MNILKFICLVLLPVYLTGCGGASAGPRVDLYATTNYALSENGAVATAQCDPENAYQVNDGEREQGGFWSGNVEGDEVVVTLSQPQIITKLRIFTNHDILLDKELGLFRAEKPFAVFLGEPDQEPYQLILPSQGRDTGCVISESGNVAYSPYGSAALCTFPEPVELDRIIVRPLDVRDDYPIPAIRVYEIEAY